MDMSVGTGYGLPALYEPNAFINEEKLAGSLKGQVVSTIRTFVIRRHN